MDKPTILATMDCLSSTRQVKVLVMMKPFSIFYPMDIQVRSNSIQKSIYNT